MSLLVPRSFFTTDRCRFSSIRRRGVNVSSGHVGHYQNHALSERGKALIESADLGVMAGIQEAADF